MAKILVVEDERIIALDIEATLLSHDHMVTALVATANDAVQSAFAEPPDLVLMDISLHGSIDGISAAKMIREKSKVPIIFLTAFGDPHTRSRMHEAGPHLLLQKPFKEYELIDAVNSALKNKITLTPEMAAVD